MILAYEGRLACHHAVAHKIGGTAPFHEDVCFVNKENGVPASGCFEVLVQIDFDFRWSHTDVTSSQYHQGSSGERCNAFCVWPVSREAGLGVFYRDVHLLCKSCRLQAIHGVITRCRCPSPWQSLQSTCPLSSPHHACLDVPNSWPRPSACSFAAHPWPSYWACSGPISAPETLQRAESLSDELDVSNSHFTMETSITLL